jgi:hypothetical protein
MTSVIYVMRRSLCKVWLDMYQGAVCINKSEKRSIHVFTRAHDFYKGSSQERFARESGDMSVLYFQQKY